MRHVPVTTYFLEMRSPDELRPRRLDDARLVIRRAETPCPEFNRFLYGAVGWSWYWIDKLAWSYEQWQAYVDRPELETWVAYFAGTPAGYFELEHQAGGNVELAYFGLLPHGLGRGWGAALLTAAVERSWVAGASRVWVHTCSLDHPAALRNYVARGFRVYQEQQTTKWIEDAPRRDWP
ncbi:MAG: GNAT family N-acetyltransferase [Pirellulaceae bacterium]